MMMMPQQFLRQREPPGVHPAAANHYPVYNSIPYQPAPRHLPRLRLPQEVPNRSQFRTTTSPVVLTPSQNQPYTPNEENLLRRKTPSGTLPAAYDAAPVDWMRPTKTARPESDSHSLRSAQWDKAVQPAGVLQLQGETNAGSGHIQVPPASYTMGSLGGNDHLSSNVRQFLVDQHQMVPPTQGSNYYNGQATGFQPMYNPIAPTASNEDPNGYQLGGGYDASNDNWNSSLGWANGQLAQPLFPQPACTLSYNTHFVTNNQGWTQSHQPLATYQSFTPTYAAMPPMPPQYPMQDTRSPISPYGMSGSVRSPHGNPQSRDEVLGWAHKCYVELLAAIQAQNRQADVHSYHAHSSKSSLLLPRPPAQPKSGLRMPALRSPCGGSPGENPFISTDVLDHRKLSRGESNNGFISPDSPFGGAYYNVHTKGIDNRQPAMDCYSPMAPLHRLSNPVPQVLPFPMPLKNALMCLGSAPLTAQRASASNNAMSALDLLDGLCVESGWSWIDGMLLGGCLAQGVGNLDRAYNLYSRILEIDENHIEASANLASTLLTLGRKPEAEKTLRKVVARRPSHFESVEHLIGLLVSERRPAEAVEIITYVEKSLRRPSRFAARSSSASSELSTSSVLSSSRFDSPSEFTNSSPFTISGSDNGRLIALIHAKGNMMYTLGDNAAASKAFEDAVLVAAGLTNSKHGISALIDRILTVLKAAVENTTLTAALEVPQTAALLPPEKAVQTARLVFPPYGKLPGLADIPEGSSSKAAVNTTSNSLLSLAKIFQDGLSTGSGGTGKSSATAGVKEILALYYLSLSLHPSPSTANNVGILLASLQQQTALSPMGRQGPSGVDLAYKYYYYGLNLDSSHAHLYTNLGSLLKDMNNIPAAIKMYEKAVSCDANFDIALANLANAVKDQGRISDAIGYYRRAVKANPEFAEAVCGLANALNSVCDWKGRGGVVRNGGNRDRWHVDDSGMLKDAKQYLAQSSGWMKRVVDTVEKQLREGESWGKGVMVGDVLETFLREVELADGSVWTDGRRNRLRAVVEGWMTQPYAATKIIRMIERVGRKAVWRWYQDRYVRKIEKPTTSYLRPTLPSAVSTPSAPTVLPFHTFTCPLSAQQVRLISERNGLRISCSTLRASWLPAHVYSPPSPPAPYLRVGYVSSDFNNHPLAHLMQSVFGLHDPRRVKAFCYATTASDNSEHRKQIEREAPVFHDAHSWGPDRLVQQIINDGIHILINLNGFTRGARNEIFAARPAPIQMSFMGFAGTLGADWCDYLYADSTAIPAETLRPLRSNFEVEDDGEPIMASDGEEQKWVYAENIIFSRYSFFCCDHKQSAPDSKQRQLSWDEESARRWNMRKTIFPQLKKDQIILANFNQLYKIEPTTFRTWLRILSHVPNAVLWLLRFPDLGESNLRSLAEQWAGSEVASRILFTDVAPKPLHISRAQVCDMFLDTPECNAHTTAADVLWSGTPLLTYPRHPHKMCSRIAASILRAAVPRGNKGEGMANKLIVASDEEYEERAIELALGMSYTEDGRGEGELAEIRKTLFEGRRESMLFDTKRWVSDLEDAYEEAWRKWVLQEGGDIWLKDVPIGGRWN